MNNFDVLKNCILFEGISEADLAETLTCLNARAKTFEKGEYILKRGDKASLCIVLNGNVSLVKEDIHGGCTVMGTAIQGEIFGEVYACTKSAVMEASAVAETTCTVLFLDISCVLTQKAIQCRYNAQLLQNLLSAIAEKSLALSRKAEYISKKTLREKILAYLNAASLQSGTTIFEIPFNRQQMADYLGADRSALSAELSKMKKEGIIDYQKSSFKLF